MPIRIKNSGVIADPVVGVGLKIGVKPVTISEVYVKDLQVFPDPTTTTTTTVGASGVATATLSVAGAIRTGNATFASTQFATSGSGSGATFDVVINNRTATSFSVTGAGTGYAVGDTITLQVGSVPSFFQNPRVELTVASLG